MLSLINSAAFSNVPGRKWEEPGHNLPPTESEYEQELILQGTSAAGANLGKPLHGPEEARDPSDYVHCLSMLLYP